MSHVVLVDREIQLMKIYLVAPILLLCASITSSLIAAPVINKLTPIGLQAGQDVILTVDGTDLLPNPRLIASFPIETQEIQANPAANKVTLKLKIPADVDTGIHTIRIASDGGSSNSLAIAVDRLPQQAFAENISALPMAVNGQLAGGTILKTEFAGKQGMKIVVDVEARRLGSMMRPVIRLVDSRGTQLAWSPPQPSLQGDARCETELPADGSYTIQLHDLLYKGPQPGYFRLKVGELQYADRAHPIGVQRGQSATVLPVSTNLPGGPGINITGDNLSGQALAIGTSGLFGGTRPRIVLSSHAEVVEVAGDTDSLQDLPAAPVAINGQISQAGQVDRYRLVVKPGSTLRFDVVAHRYGSAIDGVLSILDEQGKQLARNDDRGGNSDPGMDLKIPGNLNHVVVQFQNLNRSGSPGHVYRIAVEDLGQPDFTITAPVNRLSVPMGATASIKIQVARRGYNGPIQLSIPGLPDRITLSGTTIPAGTNIGLVGITAVAGDLHLLDIQLLGSSEDGELTRHARSAVTAASRIQPWLRDSLAVSVIGAAPITASWLDDTNGSILQGSFYSLPVQVTRGDGVAGNIRFRLETTQVIPKKKVKQNNKDVMVDDLDRALRLEQPPMLDATTNQATLQLWVPADLGIRNWDLSVVAELLSADNKTVITSVVTPVKTLLAHVPMKIALVSEATIEARAGEGETGHLKGTIQREAGYAMPVSVTLRGLPKGYPAPTVEVAGDVSEFDLEVRFPDGTTPAELKNIQLVGTVKPDPKKQEITFSSNTIPVTIKVVAP
jgi:hypothetical protein